VCKYKNPQNLKIKESYAIGMYCTLYMSLYRQWIECYFSTNLLLIKICHHSLALMETSEFEKRNNYKIQNNSNQDSKKN